MRIAKAQRLPIFLIGHITKEGAIAGPRILEHMVDTVLYFEGESRTQLRLLRSFKNRFGATNETGIFEMRREGLVDAGTLAKRFFDKEQLKAGSALTVVLEGSRPIVIEIQALVAEAYGHAKRSATGFENNRLSMLLALLEKKLELPLGTYDVYVNVTGGIRLNDPSADLAVIAAILSSFKERELSAKSIFLGEVSLTGEVRPVTQLDLRLKEAQAQGFEKAIVPKNGTIDTETPKLFAIEEVSKIIEWL